MKPKWCRWDSACIWMTFNCHINHWNHQIDLLGCMPDGLSRKLVLKIPFHPNSFADGVASAPRLDNQYKLMFTLFIIRCLVVSDTQWLTSLAKGLIEAA